MLQKKKNKSRKWREKNVLLRKLINGKKVPDIVVKGREAEKRKNT